MHGERVVVPAGTVGPLLMAIINACAGVTVSREKLGNQLPGKVRKRALFCESGGVSESRERFRLVCVV